MGSGEGTYTGETIRSGFERVREHYSAMDSLRKDSQMVNYWFTTHSTLNEAPPFRFKKKLKVQRLPDTQTEAVILGKSPTLYTERESMVAAQFPDLR
jgi:hypothetical protein